jgi:N-acetylmuramoyl-L-alanine amidase CwlA
MSRTKHIRGEYEKIPLNEFAKKGIERLGEVLPLYDQAIKLKKQRYVLYLTSVELQRNLKVEVDKILKPLLKETTAYRIISEIGFEYQWLIIARRRSLLNSGQLKKSQLKKYNAIFYDKTGKKYYLGESGYKKRTKLKEKRENIVKAAEKEQKEAWKAPITL